MKIKGEDYKDSFNNIINIKEFSGSSPPEIFVGRWNYPDVYAGILSPQKQGNTEIFSSPKIWNKNKVPIQSIINLRNKLIYGRLKINVKKPKNKIIPAMQEIALAYKPVSTEFKLKGPIKLNEERETKVPIIPKASEVERIRLQENPKIKREVEYITNDISLKATEALIELEKAGIDNYSMTRLLSAGLIGTAKNRKMVPTRWSITAVDNILSKEKIKKIRLYPKINEIMVFNGEYLGNHYEFILLPEKWGFEVIEISSSNKEYWHDYEIFFGRKDYAKDVTGAYYANRLALTEYLEKIKRQCLCIIFREIRPEYNAPLGVGILREITREAFMHESEKFNNISDALKRIQERLITPIENFTEKSVFLKNYKKQKKLTEFLK